jgi:hypothetical protein
MTGRSELSDLDKSFLDFHLKNPHVYVLLVSLARTAAKKGRKKIGIGMLFERVRWEIFITTTGDDYKLNNNHRSRYARLIMDAEPDLKDAFEVRELKS